MNRPLPDQKVIKKLKEAEAKVAKLKQKVERGGASKHEPDKKRQRAHSNVVDKKHETIEINPMDGLEEKQKRAKLDELAEKHFQIYLNNRIDNEHFSIEMISKTTLFK